VDEPWTLQELVAEASARLAALPPPKNGQVRAVPDDRTIRYYAAIGLLDRPAAMRGRTALYAARHLAQVVAIKRMQSAGKSLAEIQELWATVDDVTLARMSGVALQAPAAAKKKAARTDFWKRDAQLGASRGHQPPVSPAPTPHAYPVPPRSLPLAPPEPAVEVRIEIAPGAFLTVGLSDGVSLTPADVRALRAAAAPLATELANRGLTAHALGTMEEP
jgi:DNA-binding transcriptional MerR regulator